MPVLNNIHYLDSESGKELVLIYGFLGSNALWKYQIKEFQKYFRVIVIDHPEYDKNNKAKPLNGIKKFSKAVEKLLHILKINNFYLMGHSMGGILGRSQRPRFKSAGSFAIY